MSNSMVIACAPREHRVVRDAEIVLSAGSNCSWMPHGNFCKVQCPQLWRDIRLGHLQPLSGNADTDSTSNTFAPGDTGGCGVGESPYVNEREQPLNQSFGSSSIRTGI